MKTYYAKDYGVGNKRDISKALIEIFDDMKATDEEKELVFEPGTYTINSNGCTKKKLYITNTVGDKEFSADETPHANCIAFYLKDIENLTIKGNGAIFVINGKATNMALEKCKSITIDNIEIRHLNPDMQELKVINKSLFYVDYEIDRDTNCEMRGNMLHYFGQDFDHPANKEAVTAYYNGVIKPETPNKIERIKHPLFGALKIKELGKNKYRVYYPNTRRFSVGNCYYTFEGRRQFVGIFINRCKDIKFTNIKQRFNYSLGVVGQDSKNISIDNCIFASEEGSARKIAAVADFLHFCMCKGKIRVTNCYFDGAGDDCLNVHGIHFKIKKIDGDKIIVRFMHPQAHGFKPIHKGDEIAFINPTTLLEEGRARVLKSELLNEYDIELTLDSAKNAKIGNAIEDLQYCPDVLFENNTLTRIITRGILLTTRGKVVVRGNHFISNTMAGVLLSDDARTWYESSMCRDVTIENNTFDYCGANGVLIKPENLNHAGAVHKNIVIKNNKFNSYVGPCIYAKSTDNIKIEGNTYCNSKKFKTKNCTNVEMND